MAVETAGTWNQSEIELIQEIGRCITAATEDAIETVFLFADCPLLTKGGMRSPFWQHLTPCDTQSWSLFSFMLTVIIIIIIIIIIITRMLAINVSIPNLKIARLVQF